VDIETAPPLSALPGHAGNWTGRDILFCQSDQCGQSWPLEENLQGNPAACPSCGSAMDRWSLGEKHSLNADTLLLRRQYTNASLGALTLSAVVSPPNRNSIHRPQTCIFGQGYHIARQEVLTIPVPARSPLDLTVLQLARTSTSPGNQPVETTAYLAYWFMDRKRHTPSHTTLTLQMAIDRLIHGRVSRWAYVMVSSDSPVSATAFRQQMADFLAAAYPLMVPSDPDSTH
jgi:hypothetical protein